MTPPPIGRGVARLRALAERIARQVRELPALPHEQRAERIRQLGRELLPVDPIHLSDHVDFGIVALADLFVLERARAFAALHRDLVECTPPALLVEAGKLHFAALGPYFANVPILLRRAADVFALIDAASDGGAVESEIEAWAVLLSIHLRQHELNDLVEELGDRGMLRALGGILLRLMCRGTFWRWDDTVRKIRDVCLDLGAYPLAGVAQHLQALWSRIDPTEWTILGDVRAAGGDAAGAERAYQRALFLQPSEVAHARLILLRDGAPVHVAGGYDTPPGRQKLRLARLEAFRQSSAP
jgi:hypothetical protein